MAKMKPTQVTLPFNHDMYAMEIVDDLAAVLGKLGIKVEVEECPEDWQGDPGDDPRWEEGDVIVTFTKKKAAGKRRRKS